MNKYKFSIFISLFILSGNALFSENIYNNLPERAVNFINQYFEYNIAYTDKLNKFFKAILENGTIIIFAENGDWQEIDGNNSPIPYDFMPKNVIYTVNKTNPNTSIIRIKRRWNMYIISLDNYMNIFIDSSGMLIGQKIPD